MSQPRDYRDYLEDICQAAHKALAFVEGVGYEDFLADDKTVYAVVRALEIVGEATQEDSSGRPRPLSANPLAVDGRHPRQVDPRLHQREPRGGLEDAQRRPASLVADD